MEICQCKRYKQIVDSYKFFSFGIIQPLLPRIPMPENSCIHWKCNKANHQDQRINKPTVRGDYFENKPLETLEIEPKWIPVAPGVISQRAVNEGKHLNPPF